MALSGKNVQNQTTYLQTIAYNGIKKTAIIVINSCSVTCMSVYKSHDQNYLLLHKHFCGCADKCWN